MSDGLGKWRLPVCCVFLRLGVVADKVPFFSPPLSLTHCCHSGGGCVCVCVSYSVQWNLLNMTYKLASMPIFGGGLRAEEGLLLGRWVVTVGDDAHLKQQSVILGI